MRPAAVSLVIGAMLTCGTPAQADLRLQTVVSGLSGPVAFIADPLNPGVFYAVQQNGLIRTVQNGTLLTTPFLDVRWVIASGGERGLPGIAFAPDACRGRLF